MPFYCLLFIYKERYYAYAKFGEYILGINSSSHFQDYILTFLKVIVEYNANNTRPFQFPSYSSVWTVFLWWLAFCLKVHCLPEPSPLSSPTWGWERPTLPLLCL